MKKVLPILAGLLFAASAAHAADDPLDVGDADAGADLTNTCVACHGQDGNSSNSQWPNIAGQHAGYLYKQLKDLKAGEDRYNAQMAGIVSGLSDQEMRDLAAYYAEQPHKVTGAGDDNQDLVERGRQIYMGGIQQKGVPACAACHGPEGRGNVAADYPVVSGQWPQYLRTQLEMFRSGERANDPNGMMRNAVDNLSDEEIRAVAEYMAGLH